MKNYVPEIFNGLTYLLVVSQANEVFQIIQLVLASLTSVVLIVTRLWKWWKEAKADGKITKEEIEEGIKIISDEVDKDKKKGE